MTNALYRLLSRLFVAGGRERRGWGTDQGCGFRIAFISRRISSTGSHSSAPPIVDLACLRSEFHHGAAPSSLFFVQPLRPSQEIGDRDFQRPADQYQRINGGRFPRIFQIRNVRNAHLRLVRHSLLGQPSFDANGFQGFW